jgi:hypothetical protein
LDRFGIDLALEIKDAEIAVFSGKFDLVITFLIIQTLDLAAERLPGTSSILLLVMVQAILESKQLSLERVPLYVTNVHILCMSTWYQHETSLPMIGFMIEARQNGELVGT